MLLAEKGVRGKGRQPLSPPQHTVAPEREQRSGLEDSFRAGFLPNYFLLVWTIILFGAGECIAVTGRSSGWLLEPSEPSSRTVGVREFRGPSRR